MNPAPRDRQQLNRKLGSGERSAAGRVSLDTGVAAARLDDVLTAGLARVPVRSRSRTLGRDERSPALAGKRRSVRETWEESNQAGVGPARHTHRVGVAVAQSAVNRQGEVRIFDPVPLDTGVGVASIAEMAVAQWSQAVSRFDWLTVKPQGREATR